MPLCLASLNGMGSVTETCLTWLLREMFPIGMSGRLRTDTCGSPGVDHSRWQASAREASFGGAVASTAEDEFHERWVARELRRLLDAESESGRG